MKKNNAFTLMELLAVIALLGTILAIAIPKLLNNTSNEKDKIFKMSAINIIKDFNYKHLGEDFTSTTLLKLNLTTISSSDYDLNSSYIYVVNDKTYIYLVGLGEFEGLICHGTVENMLCQEDIATISFVYNLNGGTTSQSFESSYAPNTNITLINPTKEGYTFTGWTVQGTGASINGTELTIGTSDTTITANWEEELVNPLLSYSCENASEGSSPYILTYTGNCTVIDDGDGNWRVKFLTSGDLTMSSTTIIDAFLVGGGGGGGYTGGGGGGGYTTTAKTITLTAGTAYSISIGVGGAGQAAAASGGKGADGGASSAFNKSAAGGKGGKGDSYTNHSRAGGDGGSGGGSYDNTINISGVGGSDGGDGGIGRGGLAGGVGQGTTTREFGESSGALYAGGGGAACYNPSSGAGTGAAGGGGGGGTGGRSSHYIGSEGEVNTGGGGGGMYNGAGMAGGSGIVIIRNAR